MKDSYSKYWIKARKDKYGFGDYDHDLCYIVESCTKAKSKLAEFAAGTGYPVADYLQNHEREVYALDISESLVREGFHLNPLIHYLVNDAENASLMSESFDCCYCFHSSWYFPSLCALISEMIRVTRHQGMVVFDIQNKTNLIIAEHTAKITSSFHGLKLVKTYTKAIVAAILGKPDHRIHVLQREIPSDPFEVLDLVKKYGCSIQEIYGTKLVVGMIEKITIGRIREFPRLVFILQKG